MAAREASRSRAIEKIARAVRSARRRGVGLVRRALDLVEPPRSIRLPLVDMLSVDRAWPVVAATFPEPYLFHPSVADREVLALDPTFGHGPLVLPAVLVNDIPGGQVHAAGPIGVADGRILVESAKRPWQLLQFFEEPPYRLEEKEVVARSGLGSTIIAVKRHDNYFHWLVDMIPRLHALEQIGESVELVCPAGLPSFAEELLDRFAGPPFTVIYQPLGSIVRYDVARLSGFTSAFAHGLLRPEIATWLRPRLLGRQPRRDGPGRRLYIRRVGTRWNNVANDDELIRSLRSYGVEAVRPEELSLSGQLELFSEAELIMGPHGAGLANMLAATDAAIVDIHPNGLDGTRVYLAYWSLAQTCGHRYLAVLNETPRQQPSFVVDVSRVCEAVERALDTSPDAPACAVV